MIVPTILLLASATVYGKNGLSSEVGKTFRLLEKGVSDAVSEDSIGCPTSAVTGVCSGHGSCIQGACKCSDGYSSFDCSVKGCPNGCSGQGECVQGVCYCFEGHAGIDCSERACKEGCNSHGTCSKGICTCDAGWQGESCKEVHCEDDCHNNGVCQAGGTCLCNEDFTGKTCSVPACPMSDEKVCGGSGRCVDGACVCHDGYEGADCSLTKCPNDCSLHGVCQDFKCSCSPGWESHDCSVKKCPALCDDHGYCEDGKCVCAEGWSNFPGGNSCQKAVCAGAPDCSGHGVCAPSGKGENKCHCENPWTIESLCAEKSCADDCSSRGSCNNGTCACDDGFWGISCGNVECPKDESWSEGDPRCSGHGTCQQSGVCDCEDGFRGDSCAFRACMNDCSGRGTCTDGICECTDKYFGEDCSKIRCSSDPEKPDCSDSGECIEGVCFCTSGFTGDECQYRACPRSCSGNGICDPKTGVCECSTGWKSEGCDERYVVEGHGVVDEDGNVKCFAKYYGESCESIRCPLDCSGSGTCDGVTGTCQCDSKFTGAGCNQPACPNGCFGKGSCSQGKCTCNPGYRGDDCSIRYVLHGSCSKESMECTCKNVTEPAFPGQIWTGDDCSSKSCEDPTCGGRGTCGKDGICECENGFFGEKCERSMCPSECSFRGRCVETDDGSSVCDCDEGYQGESCSERNLNNCHGHGKIENDACVCDAVAEDDALFSGQMWEGETCSTKSTKDPECPIGCGTHGKCVEENKCECDLGWGGKACTTRVCNGCSNHGSCHEDTYCICDQGFTGPECSVKLCGTHNCTGNGQCIDGSCLCNPKFTGTDCSIEIGCKDMCHHHGECKQSGENTWSCECFPSFVGDSCEERGCSSSNGKKCSGHGTCKDDYTCQCEDGYTSVDCSHIECKSECLNGATCNADGECMCLPGFNGEQCELKTCPNSCSQQGVCDTSTGSCQCSQGYGGNDCSERVCTDPVCGGHGKCKELSDNQGHMCMCDDNHFGLGCENKTCASHHECSPPNGICVDGSCFCREGWGSADCSVVRQCPGKCSGHGTCDSKTLKCTCDENFAGESCNEKRTCPTSDEGLTCSGHGRCDSKTQVCTCESPYVGDDCATLGCGDKQCLNGGLCVSGNCLCKRGYTGSQCEISTCIDGCNGHGTCTGTTCDCEPNYKGESCSVRQCPHDCSSIGSCDTKNNYKCTCPDTHTGSGCEFEKIKCHNEGKPVYETGSKPRCVCKKGFSEESNCEKKSCGLEGCGRGSCNDGTCVCPAGIQGDHCEEVGCGLTGCYHGKCDSGKCVCELGYDASTNCQYKKVDCNNHGVAVKGVCVCDVGYTGPSCKSKVCPNMCSGHGECLATGKCNCIASYKGEACDVKEPNCPNSCSGHGSCDVTLGKCVCHETASGEKLYAGDDCSQVLCPRGCSGKGSCVQGVCECERGWAGATCSTQMCKNDCSGRGFCSSGSCICQVGFSGEDCSKVVSVASSATSCAVSCTKKCLTGLKAEEFEKYDECNRKCTESCALKDGSSLLELNQRRRLRRKL